ncbi:hypothetical protein OLT88_04535, partial [Campylobacter jejuni]|nr:hypothetical protein [Campylobacter jejuni]
KEGFVCLITHQNYNYSPLLKNNFLFKFSTAISNSLALVLHIIAFASFSLFPFLDFSVPLKSLGAFKIPK